MIGSQHRTTTILCAIALIGCSNTPERIDIEAFIDDVPLTVDCADYPIRWEPRGRRTLVESSLTALDPEGELVWNTARDTPFSIQMDVRMRPCDRDREPLLTAVWEFMEANPGVFLLDQDDWTAGDVTTTCGDLVEGQRRQLSFSRHSIGPLPVHRGTFSVTLARVDGRVHFQEYTGTHVPVATNDLIDALQACPVLQDDELQALVASEPLPWQDCDDDSEHSLTTHPDDELTLTAPAAWSWTETDGVLTFARTVDATYRVAPERWELGMAGSDAYCDDNADGNASVGWSLGIDTVLPDVLWVSPGLGCTTCE